MSTLITAAVIIVSLVIFVGLLNLLNKKAKHTRALRQENVFEALVWKNKLAIHQKEHINDYILAIDKLNFLLVYIDFSMPKEAAIIDLWNVRSVKLITETTGLYEQKKQQMQIVLEDSSLPTHTLVLYDLQLHGIGQFEPAKLRGEYWEELLQNCLKELPAHAAVSRTA